MKVYPRKAWPGAAFILQGSALEYIWKWLIVLGLWAGLVTWLGTTHDLKAEYGIELSTTPLSLVGVALSIFLGFRNNACYDRFWEGRKLWGALVNMSRSFTRQVLTFAHTEVAEEEEALRRWKEKMVHRMAAYVHLFRMMLRNDKRYSEELSGMLSEEEVAMLLDESNPCVVVTQQLGYELSVAYRRGWIDKYHLPLLENSLVDITNIQGGCERIKSTPLPQSYTILTHRIVAVFCGVLPLGVFGEVGLLTPLVTLVVSYAYLGLDAIGAQIEEPFGHDPNDLPLSQLSRMIEINLRERLGEAELPPQVVPVNNILS